MSAARIPSFPLENRFRPALVAVCTYVMLRLGTFRFALYDICKRPSVPNTVKFVALLLCIPAVKLGDLCFEVAYLLNKRHLNRLGFHDLAADRKYRLLKHGSVVDILEAAKGIERRLKGGEPRHNFPNH